MLIIYSLSVSPHCTKISVAARFSQLNFELKSNQKRYHTQHSKVLSFFISEQKYSFKSYFERKFDFSIYHNF